MHSNMALLMMEKQKNCFTIMHVVMTACSQMSLICIYRKYWSWRTPIFVKQMRQEPILLFKPILYTQLRLKSNFDQRCHKFQSGIAVEYFTLEPFQVAF